MVQEKINIAKLLKNYPQGMELDCTMYNKVSLLNVDNDENITFPIRVVREDGCCITLTKYGQYTDADFAKCVIFPKGKTTWEEFQRPFKDGDIIANDVYIAIFHKCGKPDSCISNNIVYYHCWYHKKYKDSKFEKNYGIGRDCEYRFATEEEKSKLFQAIKDNGYKWNVETNTLEKLIEQKFKDGDVVSVTMYPEGTWIGIFKQYEVNSFESHCCLNTIGEFHSISYKGHSLKGTHLATEEEKQKLFAVIKEHGYKWNAETKTLEKLLRFKAGNKVTNGNIYITIGYVDNKYYYDETGRDISNILSIENQDNWKLVLNKPNKFDISTLIPFESRVLVRDGKSYKWLPAVWGVYDEDDGNNYPYYVIGGQCFQYCIPYEHNEHLRGKTDDCDEFYKTWKE